MPRAAAHGLIQPEMCPSFYWLGVCGCLALGSILGEASPSYVPSTLKPPAPAREFRGVWVATVANLNWPSKPGLTTAEQQVELTAIMDQAAQLKLNAVIFQVRPACDALYASRLEPWSEYLTGNMGQAPKPYYDPLAFAIQAAHQRGLELHAWFNPFRARHNKILSACSTNHISRRQPRLVKAYAKYQWLDPGEPAAREQSLRVILDVVKRYDIDGVHLDDYFYPYPENNSAGKVIDFPDSQSYSREAARNGAPGKEDWRRENINQFLRQLYEAIDQRQPGLFFDHHQVARLRGGADFGRGGNKHQMHRVLHRHPGGHVEIRAVQEKSRIERGEGIVRRPGEFGQVRFEGRLAGGQRRRQAAQVTPLRRGQPQR